MLAAALPLLALTRGGSPRQWLAYGLLQSLALHAHPATIVLALALPVVLGLTGFYRPEERALIGTLLTRLR